MFALGQRRIFDLGRCGPTATCHWTSVKNDEPTVHTRKKGNICSLYLFRNTPFLTVCLSSCGGYTDIGKFASVRRRLRPQRWRVGDECPGIASHCRWLANSYGHQKRRFFVASNSTERNINESIV